MKPSSERGLVRRHQAATATAPATATATENSPPREEDDKKENDKKERNPTWTQAMLGLVGMKDFINFGLGKTATACCLMVVAMLLVFAFQTVAGNWLTDTQHKLSVDHHVLEALRASTFQYCTKEEELDTMHITYQPRSHLVQEFKDLLINDNSAIVVMGPRGSGKTTLIQKVLCEKKGVVHVSLRSNENTDFGLAVLTSLGVSNEVSLLRALAELKIERATHLKGNRVPLPQPTIVFSVDSNASAQQVQDLLLWSKDIQHEKRLARIVIDISQTRVSLNLDINLLALRTNIFRVPLMSEAEARGMLSKVVTEADADYAVTRIGYLPLDIQNLVKRCNGIYTTFEKVVDAYAQIIRYQMEASAQNFAAHVELNDEAKLLFQKMVKGEAVPLGKLAEALHIYQRQVIQADSMAPHILQIDPLSKDVSFSSDMAMDALMIWLSPDK